jgi:hypothetical protein
MPTMWRLSARRMMTPSSWLVFGETVSLQILFFHLPLLPGFVNFRVVPRFFQAHILLNLPLTVRPTRRRAASMVKDRRRRHLTDIVVVVNYVYRFGWPNRVVCCHDKFATAAASTRPSRAFL